MAVITISREYGSGGRFIGEEVAKRLGYYYLDKDIVAKIAEKTGFAKEFIVEKAEYAPSSSIFGYGFLGRNPNGTSLEDVIYSEQTKIIKETAERGDCVIIGRNADTILADKEGVINIFICGREKEKIKTVMKRYDISQKEALKMMERIDRKRATNYKYYTDKEWGSAKNYTLCLNSSDLGYEKVIEMIMSLVK